MKLLSHRMKKAGIEADSVISRLGGDVELYLSICLKFINDPTLASIMKAVADNNLSAAGMHIHTLMGIAANLGFTRLQEQCVTLLEELKSNNYIRFNTDIRRLKKEYCSLISFLNILRTKVK